MNTCAIYSQNLFTTFPARSDFPRMIPIQTGPRVLAVETVGALFPVPRSLAWMCLSTRFIQQRKRENSCVCPSCFITPTHEQTVYLWKLTRCSVNSSLTSGMGTDDLPERPQAHPLPSASAALFSPRPASSSLFFCVQTKKTEDKLTKTQRCYRDYAARHHKHPRGSVGPQKPLLLVL